MAIEKKVYTAHAVATGGRDGVAKSDDGHLDVKLQMPKEMGGTGEGTNPEQLFAAGYAACFIGALKHVAGEQKLRLDPGTFINSSVSFGPLANGARGFGIEVALEVHIPASSTIRRSNSSTPPTRCAPTRTRPATTSTSLSPSPDPMRQHQTGPVLV